MAKSKSGGTRSYIRGRVGADVYSIGKDAKGAKQQVVRSLAETVSNPQTTAQMRGRMIMSTVMQAVSALRPIIDHSFDDVPNGQPCISEFISRNYALIKADVAAHPATGNDFALNEHNEKGIQGGEYMISNGQVALPQNLVVSESGDIDIVLSENATVGDLKTALGLGNDDYFTLVWVTMNSGAFYMRYHINASIADTTVLTQEVMTNLFTTEGVGTGTKTFAQNTASFSIVTPDSELPVAHGVIVSVKETSGYKHNACTLANVAENLYNDKAADIVLPSYPIGSERFLNGGDL